ncbi:cupredoxin domain-containing protein [Candidatus Pacearchaeota archaeon]|nr:cupredoxin domain-containing protein [Candidatus Pacearchaeota archaeon]
MKNGVWIASMVGFAFVLLAANIIYTASDNVMTGKVVGELEAPGVIHKISIRDYKYSVETLEISVGDTVAWANFDGVQHTVTSEDGEELNSALLKNREMYIHVFDKKGTYPYYCKPHPTMKGKIIVK